MATAYERPLPAQKPGTANRPTPVGTGIWLGLAAITMTFAAITSAMLVRQSSAGDWQHFRFPSVLYLDTTILIASCLTLWLSRRGFDAVRHGKQRVSPSSMLIATLALGLLFIGGEYRAWMELRAEGVHLATSPSSSFFYLFTGLHTLHVIAGLAALTVAIWRARHRSLRISTFDSVLRYWNCMTVLWLCLLVLLRSRI